MADYRVTDTELTSIANAIRTKGGTSASLEFPTGFVSAIGSIPSGGGTPNYPKQVNFYDYDGTLLHAYTLSEFQNEFSGTQGLPQNPSHSGLTAQGWNWTYSDIVANIVDRIDVGQNYITDDGKTRIYIHLDDGRLDPWLSLAVGGSVDIDWGDGSAHSTITGENAGSSAVSSTQHVYSSPGDYVINLTVTGTASITGAVNIGSKLLWDADSSISYSHRGYQSSIRRIEVGSNVRISTYGCNALSNLEYITIPSNISNLLMGNAFQNDYNLKCIVLPDVPTSIGARAFSNCYALRIASINKKAVTIAQYAFNYCTSLEHAPITKAVTRIDTGAFSYCYRLRKVKLSSQIATFAAGVFQYCYGLNKAEINISAADFSQAFNNCQTLEYAIIDGAKNIKSTCFASCYSLRKLELRSSIESIAASSISNCYSLGEIHFYSNTPPTVADSNAFTNLPTDCKIYVPTGKLSAYTSASNYPDPNTYTYAEE